MDIRTDIEASFRMKFVAVLRVLTFFVSLLVLCSTVKAQEADTALVLKGKEVESKWNKGGFSPSPGRAALYSAILPGLGQAYNRQYWKIPIIYGGIEGSVYGLMWNHRQYKDYFNAYRDLTVLDADGNRVGDSYLDLLPRGRTLDDVDLEWFERILKSRKDRFKRSRDMSILILVGVYVLNIIDASVDAHLFDFDVSEDLSVRLFSIDAAPPAFTKDIEQLQAQIGITFSYHF